MQAASRSGPGLGRIFSQDFLERSDKEVRIGVRKNQRRAKLDNVVVRAVRASKDSAFSQAVDDVRGLLGRGVAVLVIEHQIQS